MLIARFSGQEDSNIGTSVKDSRICCGMSSRELGVTGEVMGGGIGRITGDVLGKWNR